MKTLGIGTGSTEASFSNRIQYMEETISGTEYTFKTMNAPVTENVQSKKKNPDTNIQEIWDTMKRPNLRIIDIQEGEEMQVNRPDQSVSSKSWKKNFLT